MRHQSTKCETSRQVDSDVLSEALRLQRTGISIIPIGKKKKPALPSWKPYQTTAADESQIFDWFDRRDDLGLAIVLGRVSGHLAVRDFDAEAAWREWARQFPTLANVLPFVETSQGRRHYYGLILNCPSLKFDDGELRSNGNYVVAPPSFHPSGCRYRWGRGFDKLSDVPTLELEETGFGRCWLPSIRQSDDTDSTQVDLYDPSDLCLSERSVLSVSWEGLIEATLPHAFGTRRHRLFELARRVRVHPELRDAPIQELKPLLKRWHQQALPFILTKCFDETWADFVEGYRNVDVVRCGDAAVIAMKAADAKELPPEAKHYSSREIRRLVALCAELSRASPDRNFFLSCRKATEVLGLPNHRSVGRWLQMLVADQLLEEKTKGGPHTNQATRFKWLGI